jgi:hypothetical protein
VCPTDTNRDIFPITVGLTTIGYLLISVGWKDEFSANSMRTATESTNVNTGGRTGATTGATAGGTAITITNKSANTDASIAKKTGMSTGNSTGKNADKNPENMTRLIAGLHQKGTAPKNGCSPKAP